MNWPRGRYNGQRIVGAIIKVRFDVTDWGLRWFGRHGSCGQFGPFRVWVESAFHWEDGR